MALTRINNQALTNVTSAGLPSGAVIQVKRGVNTTTTGNLTTTYSDVSGLSISITPSSASSTFYMVAHIASEVTSAAGIGIRFVRDGSEIYNPSAQTPTLHYLMYSGNGSLYAPISFDYIDSPATTSAITYKVQARLYNTGNARVGYNESTDSKSSFTVMEIAG